MLSIGRVSAINSNIIEIEIYSNLIDGTIIVKNELHNPINVGGYCKVYNSIGFSVIKITNEKATNISNLDSNKKMIDNYYKVIEGRIIGNFIKNEFKFGITKMPNIFASVFMLSETEKNWLLNNQKKNSILYPIGSYLIDNSISFNIDINEFLKFHTAIFGVTGTGKSNTIGKILEMVNLAEKDQQLKKIRELNLVVFDLTGEFKNIEEGNLINFDKFKIPVEKLDYKDWSVLLSASKKTQETFLKNVDNNFQKINSSESLVSTINSIIFTILKEIKPSTKNDTELKSKIDTLNQELIELSEKDLFYKDIFSKIVAIFKEISIDFGQLIYKNNKYEPIAKIKRDINAIKNDIKSENYKMIFDIYDTIFTLTELVYQLKGGLFYNNIRYLVYRYKRYRKDLENFFISKSQNISIIDEIMKNNLSIIDLSSNLIYLSTVVGGLIATKLYESIKLEKKDRNLILIFDEAHKYMEKISSEDYENRTQELLEEISREGRKYGVSLFISSQKPSDISEIIVSQCSNLIIHKIISPIDINKISNVISYLDKQSLEILSYLAPGNAIFAGRFQEYPQIVEIYRPNKNFRPNSDVDDIFKKINR